MYLIVPLFFIVLIFSLFAFLKTPETNNLYLSFLSVATFLFGILIAFSISDRHNRLEQIRENDSNERAQLVLIYGLSKQLGNSISKKLQKIIDNYIQKTLDYTIWDYHKTEPQFQKIIDFISPFSRKRSQTVLIDNMMGILKELSTARRKTIALIDDRLTKVEWTIFSLLSSIIILTLLFISIKSWVVIFIVSALSISLILILLLLRSLDDLSWKEEERIFEPYQEALESIGVMRYYPEDLIVQKKVKNHSKYEYRIGIFPKPYPNLSGKKIKIIRKK